MKIQSYTSTEIGVEFKVWAPTFNRVTHRLYLLGSLKELGTWAIEAALQAYPTTDFHIWRVQAALPPMSRFEWVWLKTNVKTQKVEWERPVKRNRALSCYSGVLHTVWGEHEEVFLQRAANVELTTFKKVGDGYALVLTGASPTLGAWDLQKAVPACEFPRRSGYWKANFSFDACTNLDFKWAIVKEKDRGSVLVQEKVPHHLYGRQTWMRVAAPWMTSSTVVVDILPLDETLDSKSGRTDVIIRERKRRLVEIRTWLVKARDAAGFGMQSMSDLTRPIMSPSRANRSQVEIKATPSRYANASPSTRMLRDEAIEQDIKKRAESDGERLTHQLSRDFRNQPQVFAIKGAGQKEMPTDVVNAGCLRQLRGLVPEGERRVLDHPPDRDVSLWSLSMGLVTPSPRAPPERQTPEDTPVSRRGTESPSGGDAVGVGASCAFISGQPPAGDFWMGEPAEVCPGWEVAAADMQRKYDPQKIFEDFTGRMNQVEESTVCQESMKRKEENTEGSSKDEGHGASQQSVLQIEKHRRRTSEAAVNPASDEKTRPTEKSKLNRQEEDESLKFCDKSGIIESENGEYAHIVSGGPILSEHTAEELDPSEENLVDASEFFKSLEICHSEAMLASPGGKLSPCASDLLFGDSGLSSFGPDVYLSRSANEATPNDPDLLSLADDTATLSQRQELGEMELAASAQSRQPSASLWGGREVKGYAAASSLSDWDCRDEDEGYSESDTLWEDTHGWGRWRGDSLSEDLAERSEWWGPRPAYWQVLSHRRQMSLPLTAMDPPLHQRGPTIGQRHTSPDRQASRSSVSDIKHSQRRAVDSATAPGDPPYVRGLTPPMSSLHGTLEDLYQQHKDGSSWRCWARGEEEEEDEEEEEKGWCPNDEKTPEGEFQFPTLTDEVHYDEVQTLHPSSEELNLSPKISNSLTVNGTSLLCGEPDATAKETRTEPCEPNVTEITKASTGIIGGEDGDTPICDKTPPNEVLSGIEPAPTAGFYASLQYIPCEDLSIAERRAVAQAMELEWGLAAALGSNPNSPPGSEKAGSSENSPENKNYSKEKIKPSSTGLADGFLSHDMRWNTRTRSLRYCYRQAIYSPSELSCIVDHGASSVDRRAVARQMERAWGQAASSRRHWATHPRQQTCADS